MTSKLPLRMWRCFWGVWRCRRRSHQRPRSELCYDFLSIPALLPFFCLTRRHDPGHLHTDCCFEYPPPEHQIPNCRSLLLALHRAVWRTRGSCTFEKPIANVQIAGRAKIYCSRSYRLVQRNRAANTRVLLIRTLAFWKSLDSQLLNCASKLYGAESSMPRRRALFKGRFGNLLRFAESGWRGSCDTSPRRF